MKHKHYTINIILSIALIAIVTNQAIWIINMYNSYKKEIEQEINKTIEKAVYMEVTERGEKGGGFWAFPLYPEQNDTSRFISKEIRTIDTTVVVTIDRQDPNANLKIIQYFLNDIDPVNILRINEIFCQEMQSGKFPIQNTSVEYHDLRKNVVVASTVPVSSSHIASGMMVIDIMESMGIKAYVENPIMSILGRMIFQLALSIALILIAITGLFFLGRTIYIQWKQEKMRQDSINSMTHEFKRPISTAVSMISLISHYLDRNNAERAKTYAEDTLQELNKLTAYTERIQQISNNDHSTVFLNQADIKIRPFFKAIQEKYDTSSDNDEAAAGKQVNIQLRIRTMRIYLYADLLHFSNVMDNLIENAIKYSGDLLAITLSVTDTAYGLQISVKDNGIGIPKSDKKYIFDKYYRSKTRFAQQKTGFGLGLTYVKSIIEAHNGRIEVNSTVGEGSEFIIFMPVKID